MVRTPSSMVPLGTLAIPFNLLNVITNEWVGLPNKSAYKAVVIMFICNHCPFVKHISKELVKLANDYIPLNILFLAINSNDVSSYPEDSPENMILTAKEHHYPFPYLLDETQEVAKAYKAACTPDFFIYDKELHLVYRGQLDDSRPGNSIEPDGSSLRIALNCLLDNKQVPQQQNPSLGCNIKWKP
jgi:thiol-disulfide isomerase/thioredoxin